jgi:two-component system sensor histidine kinase HupT/HoxJ
MQDSAWIDVIHKMDETYAELVRNQIELEDKNHELEDAHAFIASVLTSITDILIVCDMQGRIEQVNRSLLELTSQSEQCLLGREISVLFVNEDADLMARFRKKLAGGAVQDCEMSLVGSSDEIPITVNCTLRYDSRNRPVGMVLSGRPLGELRRAYKALNAAHADLKQAQQSLVQSEKMASLGRLVAGVAHELNNPISFVYGNMHALQKNGERLSRYLQALHEGASKATLAQLREKLRINSILSDLSSLIEGTLEGAERVRDIVKDLRMFSSTQEEDAKLFNLAEVARTAVRWSSKAVRFEARVEDQLPDNLPVVGNPAQLQQVISNLVQNALDAMQDSETRQLFLSAESDGAMINLSLRDTGPGIAEDDLQRVFEPFYTTKAVGQGTGLGLSISYGIVVKHHGQMRAENHPQGGAVFTIRLPAGRDRR